MLSDNELMKILKEQREKILNKEFGIEREALKIAEKKLHLPHVVAITGMRRCGKSTLLRQIIKRFYNDEDFYYITFEDERLLNFPATEFNRIYLALLQLYGKKKTFFIDEIQNIDKFELFVRRFNDDGFKLFITGSSANLLSRELGTKLTGRHVDIVLRPFSFKEFLILNNFYFNEKNIYTTEELSEILKFFSIYLLNGGMPEYSLYNDTDFISKIYDDTVIKDIAVRHNITNTKILKELYQYLITNYAYRFSYNSIKKFIRINSINTIKKYIDFFEETYLGITVSKFDYSLKKRQVNDKKLYIADNGFLKVLSKKINYDYGFLLENLIFNNLNNNEEIYYDSNGYECDFLIVKNRKVLQAIQVAYELNEHNREREINGLLKAMEKYHLSNGLIITNLQEEELRINHKKVKIVPAWKWLLEKN